MSTPEELPVHLGGYQHLIGEVPTRAYDILVKNGAVICFAGNWEPTPVEEVEQRTGMRVYRKLACPRQGGDRALTEEEIFAERARLRKMQTDDHQMSGYAEQPPRGVANCPLPSDAKERKNIPIYSGFLKYFPLAVAYVAQISKQGNEQHNPGKPLHWDRSKSGDELDAGARHLLEAGGFDSDGARHSGKHAWRAMANLQKELEAAHEAGEPWFKEP